MDLHGNNVHHIGYAHPRLIDAIRRQMDKLSFAPRRYTCAPAVKLAEKLVDVPPAGLGKVWFAPSGSDAIEMALAYARAATGWFKTISFWDSYHGAGFAARSIGGEAMFRSGPIGPLLSGTKHVPPFGDYRNAWGVTEGSAELCVRMIRYILEKEGDIAAVIAESVRAVPYVPPAGFWPAVRQACDEFGTLLIFDEIPTGLGKTGKIFACQLVANAAHVGAVGLRRLRGIMDRHPLIGDVRGRSCLMGAELVVDRTTRTPACDAAGAVLYQALNRSLDFKTTMGNVLTLTPPLSITERQMLQALEILKESIGEAELKMGITQS